MYKIALGSLVLIAIFWVGILGSMIISAIIAAPWQALIVLGIILAWCGLSYLVGAFLWV